MSSVHPVETTAQPPGVVQLRTAGLERLRSGEDPESIARDLSKKGLPAAELQNLFQDAAGEQRRRGLFRIVAGIILLLITGLIVWAASEAGFVIYGPGLLIGLFVTLNGVLKLKNGGEIARAVAATVR